MNTARGNVEKLVICEAYYPSEAASVWVVRYTIGFPLRWGSMYRLPLVECGCDRKQNLHALRDGADYCRRVHRVASR